MQPLAFFGGPVAEIAVGVAVNPDGTVSERAQSFEALGRKRPSGNVPAGQHDVGRLTLDLGEHRLERGQVAVDVVEPRLPPDGRLRVLDVSELLERRRGSRPAPPVSARGVISTFTHLS